MPVILNKYSGYFTHAVLVAFFCGAAGGGGGGGVGFSVSFTGMRSVDGTLWSWVVCGQGVSHVGISSVPETLGCGVGPAYTYSP